MSKRSSVSIANLLIFVAMLALIAGVLWSRFYVQAPKEKKKSHNFSQDLLTQAEILGRIWKEGDTRGLLERKALDCPRLDLSDEVHPSFYQCNYLYLLCRIDNGVLTNFRLQGQRFDHKGGLLIDLEYLNAEKSASLRFEDSCPRVKLLHSVYSAGPLEGEVYLWDNFGQKIEVDARYVTNLDVDIWRRSQGLEGPATQYALARPSIDLELEEKKAYCNFKGGQLLTSRVFDAATFFPAKGSHEYVYKFPYPWTKRKEKLMEVDCKKLFTSECDQSKYEYHSTYSPSWSGVFHALGSYVEVFDNKFEPSADLKLSSMLLPISSPWHRLGLRASSNGADLSAYNGRKLESPLEKRRSAFRCVYYR